jgi:uncharacterized protein YbaR (Trm112 family)
MRKSLMKILVCPICKGNLELKISKQEKDEIISGKLVCEKCKEIFPIKNSIPHLLPKSLQFE